LLTFLIVRTAFLLHVGMMFMLQTLTGERAPFDISLASIIDHTLLLPEATTQDIERLCDEAVHYGFAAVCVNPSHVGTCAKRLGGSRVKICTVIGFPLGATTSQAKAFEAAQAFEDGAHEVDMVLNIGMLIAGEEAFVLNDIRSVAAIAAQHNGITKVILETALLEDREKIRGSLLAKEAGAEFVKTSTGYSKAGATVDDIRLIRSAVGTSMGVKASGGIRTYRMARELVEAGATRIGTSLSVQIVTRQDDPIAMGY
jgi:deoxyribose-phosphate aldolase